MKNLCQVNSMEGSSETKIMVLTRFIFRVILISIYIQCMYIYIYCLSIIVFYCDYYYSKSQEDGTINSQSVSRISLFYCTYIYTCIIHVLPSYFLHVSCLIESPELHSPTVRSQSLGHRAWASRASC